MPSGDGGCRRASDGYTTQLGSNGCWVSAPRRISAECWRPFALAAGFLSPTTLGTSRRRKNLPQSSYEGATSVQIHSEDSLGKQTEADIKVSATPAKVGAHA